MNPQHLKNLRAVLDARRTAESLRESPDLRSSRLVPGDAPPRPRLPYIHCALVIISLAATAVILYLK
jgi:hypothetical protein